MKKKLTLFLAMLFCATAFAQDLPRIAVYVTGDMPDDHKKVFTSRMLAALVNSGHYSGIERPAAFLAETERVRTEEFGGTINDAQISEMGKLFGVKYVCIANVAKAFGTFHIDARIVDAETAKTVFAGETGGPMNTADELALALETIVRNMLGEQAAQQVQPATMPQEQPVPVHTQTIPAAPAAANTHIPALTPAPPAVKGPIKAAVYVTGVNAMIGGALTKAISSALVKSGIYKGITPIDEYVRGAAGDQQIANAGREAGVQYIFVINVAGQISVRIIDVALAAELARISLDGNISVASAGGIAVKIVDFILKSGPKSDIDVAGLGEDSYILQRQKPLGGDVYFAFTYLPVSSPIYLFAGSLQGGWVWGEGMFLGGELMYGSDGCFSYYYGGCTKEFGGFGLNFGNLYEISSEIKLVYGLSGGAWVSQNSFQAANENYDLYIFGPFARLRYRFIELSYRGLIGEGYASQLGVGLYFEGSNRYAKRPTYYLK